MSKRKENTGRTGINDADAQGKGAAYDNEYANEHLTPEQRQYNKKTKKRQ
ncbi:MAG: small acid-soluble spore protein O [Anaerobacillus sp.]